MGVRGSLRSEEKEVKFFKEKPQGTHDTKADSLRMNPKNAKTQIYLCTSLNSHKVTGYIKFIND